MVILIIVLLVLLIHVVSMLTQDRVVEYTQIEYSSALLPPALDGYKIAFIADTHDMSQKRLEEVIARCNEWQPDVLLLGGDMQQLNGGFGTMQALAQIETRDGIFGVDGNHDDLYEIYPAMYRAGMEMLPNEGRRVRDGLYIAGVRDHWNGMPDIKRATKDAQPDDFIVLLSHNPDVAMEYDTTGIPLMLSGHTHGGQVTVFGLWAPALTISGHSTRYGQKFMHGWALGKYGTDVFTTRGVGSVSYLPRVFARPEVVLLTLKSTQIDTQGKE